MRSLELKKTSRPLFDLNLQIITFLIEKDSQKMLRKLPVSSRNVSKLPPGAPRGPSRSPSGPLRPLLACSGVLGDRFRDARGPTRTTENLCFPQGSQRFSLLRQPWLFFGFSSSSEEAGPPSVDGYDCPAPQCPPGRMYLLYSIIQYTFYYFTSS